MATVVSRGGFRRGFDKLAREFGAKAPDELVSLVRQNASNVWEPPSMGPSAPLTDVLVHTQDIARPLGIEVIVEPAEVDPSLTFCVSPKSNQIFVNHRRYKGLRLLATDLKWKFGKGEELEGPGMDLLLALMGRRVGLEALDGPGKPILASRI